LHLLGVPSAEMPAGAAARAALFRALLADQRVLILLDDAGDAAQIDPLLPASPGCAVVVTVRHKLLGPPGSRRISLGGLSRAASREFLDQIAGGERVPAEPEAADSVLEACADLPLAIRVAGGRLAARPHWRVEDLAARLELANRRLAELEFGGHSVAASFEIGLAGLTESGDVGAEAAAAFRLLGLWNGADLGLGAIASLVGRTPERAEYLMEHLLDVNMVLSPQSGRYVLHDLLREFAADRARDVVGQEERRAAVARIVSWYAGSSAAMERVLRAASWNIDEPPHEGIAPIHVPKDQADAVDWGEREHANLIEVARLAAQYALLEPIRRLSSSTWTFFNQQQHLESWITINELALAAAREHGDEDAEAVVRNNLATALASSGRPDEALTHLERSAEIRREQGDVERLGGILSNLGIASMQAGRPDQAQAYFQEVLTLSRSVESQATARANLSNFHLLLGQYEDSITYGLSSVELCRLRPEPDIDLGTVLGTLADAHSGLGDFPQAAQYAREAVAVMRTIASRPGLIENLERLATIADGLGGDAQEREAADARAEALALTKQGAAGQG
ncbi:tetratricopeptide repeat protein, partial [Catenulispora pinisilvae]